MRWNRSSGMSGITLGGLKLELPVLWPLGYDHHTITSHKIYYTNERGNRNVLTVLVRNDHFCLIISCLFSWFMIHILIYSVLISSCPVHWDWWTVESHFSESSVIPNELNIHWSYIFDNHKWPIELKRPANLLQFRVAVSIIDHEWSMPWVIIPSNEVHESLHASYITRTKHQVRYSYLQTSFFSPSSPTARQAWQ